MTTEQGWLAITGAVALVALLLSVVAWRRAARADARAQSHAERLALLEMPVASAPVPVPVPVLDRPDRATYVITHLDEDRAATGPLPVTARRIEGRLFADIVARETVVGAASWTQGVRRALAPESRNRIRFQVRQETRRAGRERKAEMKVALREHRARRRAADADASADISTTLGEDVA